jgi:hypothetical protein
VRPALTKWGSGGVRVVPTSRGRTIGPVGSALGALLSHLGYQKRASALWGMVVWNRAVGEGVARHAQPERVDGSVLWVRVDSAAWAEELRWMEESLLGRINAACGHKAVTGLRMRIGRVTPYGHTSEGGTRETLAASDETGNSLESYLHEAEALIPDVDPELGQAFARWAARGLARMPGTLGSVSTARREGSGNTNEGDRERQRKASDASGAREVERE